MEYTQDFVKGRENSEFYIAQFSTVISFKKIENTMSIFLRF